MCQTTSQILYSVESDIIHVEIVVAGIVGVQDELLGGVGSGVEEDVLDKGHRRGRLFMCSESTENSSKLTNPIVK